MAPIPSGFTHSWMGLTIWVVSMWNMLLKGRRDGQFLGCLNTVVLHVPRIQISVRKAYMHKERGPLQFCLPDLVPTFWSKAEILRCLNLEVR
jgi:hypothetical protein